MKLSEIKKLIKSWFDSIDPRAATVGDLMQFCFNEPISGKKIKKAVSALAKEGFLCYVESRVRHPNTGRAIPYFRKRN